MRPAVVYTRVSTEEQLEGHSLETQTKECLRACERQKFAVVGIYCDEGRSGADPTRPAFREALAACPKEGVFVCWATDRFSRSIKDAFMVLEDELEPRGIDLLCPGDGVDTAAESGRTHFAYMAVGAEAERRRIAARMRVARRHQAEQGTTCAHAPFGYRKCGVGQIEPDPTCGPIVQQIFAWASEGLGTRVIRGRLHERGIASPAGRQHWPLTTLRRLLSNPAYLGLVQHKEDTFQGNHLALIEQALWDRVQAELAGRTGRAQREDGYVFLLSRGVLRCRRCHGRASGSYAYRRGERIPRYVCQNWSRDRSCRGMWAMAAIVEEAALRALSDGLPLPDRDANAPPDATPDLHARVLKDQLVQLRLGRERLLDGIQQGYLPADVAGSRLAELADQEARLEEALREGQKAERPRIALPGRPREGASRTELRGIIADTFEWLEYTPGQQLRGRYRTDPARVT